MQTSRRLPSNLLRAVVAIGVLSGNVSFILGAQGGTRPRYWYDWTCRHRVLGTLSGVEGDHALIQKTDGSVLRIPMSSLDPSDQLSIRACETAAQATEALSDSPYSHGRIELDKLHEELTAHGVSDSWAREIALFPDSTSKRLRGDRHLAQLHGRWVEIRGLQYQVVDVGVASDGVGISRFLVKTRQNDRIAVTPEWTAEVRVLPSFWRYATYRPPASGDAYFFRGPPSAETLQPDRQWVDRLTYDELISAWTDAKSLDFHEMRDDARKQWAEAYSHGRVAESKWHVHQGDDWMVQWKASESREHLHTAYKEYTAAIQLVPSYADAYLRRAAACMVAHLDASALEDLNEALRLAPDEKYIIMPALEMRSRIHSRTPINSGDLDAFAESHGKEAIRLTQATLIGQTDRMIEFAAEVVATSHWFATMQFTKSEADPDNPQEETQREAKMQKAQERHTAAIQEAWGSVKEKVALISQDFRAKMARARAAAEESTNRVFWMHDHAIADAEQLIELASKGNLKETTEDKPPNYLGSPVRVILLDLDNEEGSLRYSRLLTTVQGVAADGAAEEALRLLLSLDEVSCYARIRNVLQGVAQDVAEAEARRVREHLPSLTFATLDSESAHVSAFLSSRHGSGTNLENVASLDRAGYILIAKSSVTSDILTHIARKAVNYSPEANRAIYRPVVDEFSALLAGSYPNAIRANERTLGDAERSLAFMMPEAAFDFRIVFSADSFFRRSGQRHGGDLLWQFDGSIPTIRREWSAEKASRDVLDAYIAIGRAKGHIADGDYRQAISQAQAGIEKALDANLRRKAEDVLVHAVINHLNSFPISMGFGF